MYSIGRGIIEVGAAVVANKLPSAFMRTYVSSRNATFFPYAPKTDDLKTVMKQEATNIALVSGFSLAMRTILMKPLYKLSTRYKLPLELLTFAVSLAGVTTGEFLSRFLFFSKFNKRGEETTAISAKEYSEYQALKQAAVEHKWQLPKPGEMVLDEASLAKQQALATQKIEKDPFLKSIFNLDSKTQTEVSFRMNQSALGGLVPLQMTSTPSANTITTAPTRKVAFSQFSKVA